MFCFTYYYEFSNSVICSLAVSQAFEKGKEILIARLDRIREFLWSLIKYLKVTKFYTKIWYLETPTRLLPST